MFKVDGLKDVFELAATAGTFINELMKIKSNCKDGDNDCIYWSELHYPVFTPVKQVELIKLIVDKCQEIKIYKNKCMDSFLFQAQENWGEYEHKANVENFGSCLAILILELLKNNKLDKSEVRRILEDG